MAQTTSALDPCLLLCRRGLTDGSSEWRFCADERLSEAVFDLTWLIAELPLGLSTKEAIATLRQSLPPGGGFDMQAVVRALVAKSAASAMAQILKIQQIAGKGLGGIAVRDIKHGECIHTEAPLLEWTLQEGEPVTKEALEALVRALPERDREAFFGLCQNEEHGVGEKHAYGIWLSNAFPTDETNAGAKPTPVGQLRVARSSAVFSLYCRLNHGCSPNVHGAWNGLRRKQTMYALRDIRRGEELLVSYLPRLDQIRALRQAVLLRDFGFGCSCSCCQLKGNELERSDARRSRMGALRAEIQDAVSIDGFRSQIAAAIGKSSLGADANAVIQEAAKSRAGLQALRSVQGKRLHEGLALIEERLTLMREEGEASLGWDTLECASRHCHALGDKARGKQYATRAAECARLALGSHSKEVEQYLALA